MGDRQPLVLEDLHLSPPVLGGVWLFNLPVLPGYNSSGSDQAGPMTSAPERDSWSSFMGLRVFLVFFERCQDFSSWSCPYTSNPLSCVNHIVRNQLHLAFQTQLKFVLKFPMLYYNRVAQILIEGLWILTKETILYQNKECLGAKKH